MAHPPDRGPDEDGPDEDGPDEDGPDEDGPKEDGMATAEYTVGTLGAVLIAAFLFRLGLDDGWFFDELRDIIERALRPGVLVDLLEKAPWFGFGKQ